MPPEAWYTFTLLGPRAFCKPAFQKLARHETICLAPKVSDDATEAGGEACSAVARKPPTPAGQTLKPKGLFRHYCALDLHNH
jgi:hypothetical protein